MGIETQEEFWEHVEEKPVKFWIGRCPGCNIIVEGVAVMPHDGTAAINLASRVGSMAMQGLQVEKFYDETVGIRACRCNQEEGDQ